MEINIGAMIALGVFLIGQLIAGIWWASKINTTLIIVERTLTEMLVRLSKHEADFYSKSESIKDFAHRDQQIDAMWRKLDNIQEHITNCNKR